MLATSAAIGAVRTLPIACRTTRPPSPSAAPIRPSTIDKGAVGPKGLADHPAGVDAAGAGFHRHSSLGRNETSPGSPADRLILQPQLHRPRTVVDIR
jgi:hypothetical protein